MKILFRWYTKDGGYHEEEVDYEDRLIFIEWLETDPDIVKWF